MTEDTMHVVLNKGNMKETIHIKEIIWKRLVEAKIEISAEDFDIIVAEYPDNEKNRDSINPIETDIQVWISDLSMENQIRRLMEQPYGEKTPAELCESIKRIMEGKEEEKVSRIYPIKSGWRSGITDTYHLLIVMRLKESVAGYVELFEYIIDNIGEKLKRVGDFFKMDELDKQQLYGDMLKKWILFGKFAEYYMVKNGLPEPRILTQLSAARYEGSESEARIYFTKEGIDTIEKFADGSKDDGKSNSKNRDDRVIEEKNLRMIRKLMEISKQNTLHLYAEKTIDKMRDKTVHTVVELVQRKGKQNNDSDTDENTDMNTYVEFSGFMHWSLFMKGREIFAYDHGDYQFNLSNKRYAYLEDIDNLKGFDQEKREMVKKLVKILRKQKHGAVAIIFDEETSGTDEAKRLCHMKRGTRICETICYDKEMGWNEEQILAVSGIDGALFIDYNGKCLAIGVIVDGRAVKVGDVGRGARYNSIANYMKLKRGCVGIVVSEDGMVNVIQEKPIRKTKAVQSVQNV